MPGLCFAEFVEKFRNNGTLDFLGMSKLTFVCASVIGSEKSPCTNRPDLFLAKDTDWPKFVLPEPDSLMNLAR